MQRMEMIKISGWYINKERKNGWEKEKCNSMTDKDAEKINK